jgi:glycerophosphoryl diester phosphodiesterase
MSIAIGAHRGDSGFAPENTLAAFRQAVRMGVAFVEIDYHLSADDQMVVIHDAVLDRTTDAVGRPEFGAGVRVRDLEWRQLQQLDAADWPAGGWPQFRPAGIPTLQEALEEIVVRGGCECMIERKPGHAGAAPLCELIRKMGVESKVIITSDATEPDAWEFLDECLALLEGVRVAYQLARSFSRDPRQARRGQYVDCEHCLLSSEMVAQLRLEHGLHVFAWTANDSEDLRRLRRIGVEGITTDYPARALSELLVAKFPFSDGSTTNSDGPMCLSGLVVYDRDTTSSP